MPNVELSGAKLWYTREFRSRLIDIAKIKDLNYTVEIMNISPVDTSKLSTFVYYENLTFPL